MTPARCDEGRYAVVSQPAGYLITLGIDRQVAKCTTRCNDRCCAPGFGRTQCNGIRFIWRGNICAMWRIGWRRSGDDGLGEGAAGGG